MLFYVGGLMDIDTAAATALLTMASFFTFTVIIGEMAHHHSRRMYSRPG
jgi:hypothetical protein